MNRDRIVEISFRRTHAYRDCETLHHLIGAFADHMTTDNALILSDSYQFHR